MRLVEETVTGFGGRWRVQFYMRGVLDDGWKF